MVTLSVTGHLLYLSRKMALVNSQEWTSKQHMLQWDWTMCSVRTIYTYHFRFNCSKESMCKVEAFVINTIREFVYV